MRNAFPGAVPEILVSDIDKATEYYETSRGFKIDWGAEGGIAGISKGDCRMFLTDAAFRKQYGNAAPVLIWLNPAEDLELDWGTPDLEYCDRPA